MKQKQPVYRNLRSIPVYFEDTSLTSDEVFRITEFPLRLTAGKNIFKLQGNPINLNNGSYLNIEILDYNGDPIYSEVNSFIDEDNSRIISIYIYENTAPGDAEIVLVTTANTLFGQLVPEEWRDKPNVRWSRRLPVNPLAENTSEIIFETLPTVTVTEQVGVQLNRIYETLQYPTYNTGKVQYISQNGQPVLIISGGSFNNEMVGGTVTISSPENPQPTPYYTFSTIPYSTTVKKVLSTSSILLNSSYIVSATESIIPHMYNTFELSDYLLSYEAVPTYETTQNSESYALVEIDNLEPISGDVTRVKVFINNTGTIGTWELINDIALEETDIFVTNTASVEPYKSIGYITSQSIIDNYYTVSSYSGKTQETAPTLIYDTEKLSNSIKISSAADLSARNRVHILQTTSSIPGKFIKGASYKITIDAIGTKTTSTGNTNPELLIYMSGSAFNYDYTDYYNQELPVSIGKNIGKIYVNGDSQRFDDSTFYFDADETGTGVLIFVIKGGEWQLSDIRTTTDNDPGFTPEYTRIRSLVPTHHKSNVQYSFKIEYYNSAGTKSKQINYVNNINWQGGNRYVDGEYSMLTGSLYVADSLESGIAISGYKDTGFIRSLGYDGFNAGYPGFLLWSGSAMAASTTTYDGVGLELYADQDNYFRYRTKPSELDIHTQKFFLGNSGSFLSGSNGNLRIVSDTFFLGNSGSFLSGSNGIIAISSSNFSVKANGSVTASDIHLQNVAYADGFVYTTVIVDSSNYTQYYEDYTITGLAITGSSAVSKGFTKLILDGSKGGQSGQQVRIQYLPNYPIGMIIPPGYSKNSSNGYIITVENWALGGVGNFSALLFASAVASGSTTAKGNTEYGFFADMWDTAAKSFSAYNTTYLNIQSLTSTQTSYYGEGVPDYYQTYRDNGTTIPDVLSSQILPLYYGNNITFQRTVSGSASFQLKTGFWAVAHTDSNVNIRPYYPSGIKVGSKTVMGGNQAFNPFGRGSNIHYEADPNPAAVLEIRADTSSGTNGTGSIFLPPRFSDTYSGSITNPPEGAMYFNITSKKLFVYDGTTWQSCW